MKIGGALVVGLLLGLAGGLIYTWFIAPVQYYDTYPPMLAPRYRQDWVTMTVWAYGIEGNWDRTQTRLLNISELEVRESAIAVLEAAIAAGQAPEVLQRLAVLAETYGATGPGVAIYTGTSLAPAEQEQPSLPTATPMPAITHRPTPTPTKPPDPTATLVPAQPPPYQIISQTLNCEPEPRIAVSLELSRTITVRGRERVEIVGLPNRQLWLIWETGADRAITGFRLENGLGYADFVVEPGYTYNLYIDSPSGLPILTVQVEPCVTGAEGWVSRLLTIRETEEPVTPTPPPRTPQATRVAAPAATETRTTIPEPIPEN